MEILTVEQMQMAERVAMQNGISQQKLMERAGTAATNIICQQETDKNKSVAVLCGSGNNGGDALVIARQLLQQGYTVRVYLTLGIPQTELARIMLKEFLDMQGQVYLLNACSDKELQQLYASDIFIDGIFGIGFVGRNRLAPELRNLFEKINQQNAIIYALDIPSGMQADDGKIPDKCIIATYTISFATYKLAHTLAKTRTFLGKIFVVNIGIDSEIIDRLAEPVYAFTEQEFFAQLQPRALHSYKGTYGKLFCYCGSVSMMGAALISARAAYRTGVGLVYVATPEQMATTVFQQIPEAIHIPLLQNFNHNDYAFNYRRIFNNIDTMSAMLIGCGLTLDVATTKMVETLILKSQQPMVLDAAALNVIAQNPQLLQQRIAKEVIITPHYGEMARLINKSIKYVILHKVKVALEFATKYQVVVVLKGETTLIALPEGKIYLNTSGNPGLAKAGSGDALAGTIAAFLAQGKTATDAAKLGVYLHGKAADITVKETGEYAMLISDVIENYGQVLSLQNIAEK